MALKLLQRLGRGGVSRRRLPMEVLARLALGPKQWLTVVRVGKRVLLLGSSDHGPRLITEIRGEDRAAVLSEEPAAPAPGKTRGDPDLKRLLARLTLCLALIG